MSLTFALSVAGAVLGAVSLVLHALAPKSAKAAAAAAVVDKVEAEVTKL
jgi:hypothetical protein